MNDQTRTDQTWIDQTWIDHRTERTRTRTDRDQHVAPLGWEHIGLTGDYVWSSTDLPADGSFRPLRRKESMLAA
jgi:hypothetical protein